MSRAGSDVGRGPPPAGSRPRGSTTAARESESPEPHERPGEKEATMPNAITYEVHPAIGIARVGNSKQPDGYFPGPEPGEGPPASYRDAAGKLKRQAARFRMFRCERDPA